VNSLLSLGGESAGRRLASFIIDQKDKVSVFQSPETC